ncbi:hypothetical protein [Herpetosiphon gulosus]|uniref:Uncharacterized protein n=1 Tax=Herpetosiphon gulosus TaxID=1973496 RepID=A0ABP9WVE2_9CHLR
MSTHLLYLLKVNQFQNFEIDDLKRIFSEKYDNELGFGFNNYEFIDSHIYCTYVYSVNLRIKSFDEDVDMIISATRKVFYEINFILDLNNSIILVRGSADKIKRLNNTLSALSNNKLSIEHIIFDLGDIIRIIRYRSDKFILNGLIIKNYKPNESLSGRFAAKIQNQFIVPDLLDIYGVDVSEFTAICTIKDFDIQMRLSRLGALAVKGHNEGIKTLIQIIKDIVKEL